MKSKIINFYGFSFHPAGLRSCGAVPCRGQMITRCYIMFELDINKMMGKIAQQGYTIVPLNVYLKGEPEK